MGIGKQEYKEALERGEIPPMRKSEQTKEEAENMKRGQKEAKEQEGRKQEEREITAEQALHKYREALAREAREAREQKEREGKAEEGAACKAAVEIGIRYLMGQLGE